jgi:hypothetical protein
VHAFCTPGDPRILRLALTAAERFSPIDPDERQRCIVARAGEPHIFPMPA